jgi:transcription antitermination factor NusG
MLATYPWFAVRVRSHLESKVAGALLKKGYESYLPAYRVRRRWSDRIKQVDTPLFSGYTFCRFDPLRRLPILTTPGVVSIVGSASGPIAVDEKEIAAVRAMLASGLLVSPWPFLGAGQSVLIEHGPLAGTEGIVVEIKGSYRLVVSISLLQRSVSAEVEREWVRPAAPRIGEGRRRP